MIYSIEDTDGIVRLTAEAPASRPGVNPPLSVLEGPTLVIVPYAALSSGQGICVKITVR